MLVLTRQPGEKICIGSDVTITLVEIRGNRARIGIEAPEHVSILRSELQDELPADGSSGRKEIAATIPA